MECIIFSIYLKLFTGDNGIIIIIIIILYVHLKPKLYTYNILYILKINHISTCAQFENWL